MTSIRDNIGMALNNLAATATPLKKGTTALLNALGYESQRIMEMKGVDDFLRQFNADDKLTEKQRTLFKDWNKVEIVFQLTNEEIMARQELLEPRQQFDSGEIKSFLFLAVDMNEAKGKPWTRTYLADTTRVVNRLFAMPAIILFRHGQHLTLATIHRRQHKKQSDRDVLEKVTLIKDIHMKNPHRAHIDILCDLELEALLASPSARNFDQLHKAWEKTLDVESLNSKFYKEVFTWFEQTVKGCKFPSDGGGDGAAERHVIRMITRLLFIWFLKEKGLVQEELFTEGFALKELKKHDPTSTDYYRAILQNLFFATLNTAIDKREFSKANNSTHRDFNKFRYRDLLQKPDAFLQQMKSVPFVNGGLFDCLDDSKAVKAGGRRIDVFTDKEFQRKKIEVPAKLLLDDESGLFAIFHRYKFTVEENTPIDQEVALDPELLGKVFENLLAAYNPETSEDARENTGSYYTPRTVVDYMVREALVEALGQKVTPAARDRLRHLLDHSHQMDDADEIFEQKDKRSLINAIASLQTLDPAVGSGAFPMGVLQTLTLALRRIDPDNSLWEQVQKEQAQQKASQSFEQTVDKSERDARLQEISDTFEQYRDSDYGRKLYLIQNGIYGVDIQPIACQIAKLRFFISLIIEQQPERNKENLGIKPLPNLEPQFVAADTLIKLDQSKQGVLLPDEARDIKRKIHVNRESYFHANVRPKKIKLQKQARQLRDRLAEVLRESGWSEHDAECIAQWNPYDQNATAAWFDPEYMFYAADGFDVVIGNPPYIRLQKDRSRMGNRYRGQNYSTFDSEGDIYQIFYERGCSLLKTGTGILAFITSNSWMRAESGKSSRRYFSECHRSLRLLEMGKDVFEQVAVDTSIFLLHAGGESKPFPAVDMDRQAKSIFPPPEEAWHKIRPQGDAPWSIMSRPN